MLRATRACINTCMVVQDNKQQERALHSKLWFITVGPKRDSGGLKGKLGV
jgi:hypothetical protein